MGGRNEKIIYGMFMKQNAFLLCLLSLSFGCNTDGKNVTNEAQHVEEEVYKEEPETVLTELPQV